MREENRIKDVLFDTRGLTFTNYEYAMEEVKHYVE
jgi:hypothetical protein